MDIHLTPPSFTITAELSCYLVWGFLHFVIGILFLMLSCLVFFNRLAMQWFNGGYWWLFILSPIAFGLIILLNLFYIKKKEDVKTLNRNIELYRALNEANDLFLKETNLRL